MSDKDKARDYFKFDSSGLANAATAAKYLDNSENAEKAFKLVTMKEETTQVETKKKTEELAIQRIQIQEQERRKTAEYEGELAKRANEHKVQLDLQKEQ